MRFASVPTAVEGNVLPELIADFRKTSGLKVELVASHDLYDLLQRMLVSIIVKPSKVSGVNAEGANKLQSYLLAPSTQARIRGISYPGHKHVTWVPGGRHNRTAMLPKA